VISKKDKIKDFAKSLFLEVNAEGNKIHTWDSISKAVLKRFKLEIHFTTIQKWSKKYDWASTYEKLKMAGIERGQEQLQEKENKLIDEKAQTIADIYKSNKTIQRIASQSIIAKLMGQPLKNSEGNPIETTLRDEVIARVLEKAENTLLSLHDKKAVDTQKTDYTGIDVRIIKNET
jgi:organic radical activating enzyme